ncbi:LytTR family DNA-binding domain-containing protein [uncultured Chitinophaga sp.]|jgi:Response regulator of the LytR/AlgR family|uniref:LytR/AlgR family response regulator transcription factor n=1 Tax=uncultured Chitinophaga sp. TaxID=339340 RepID=UPI00262B4634|nr:LytTR family DNA-binding domain-containing protein [uncultured Chitinophaga sp.]
MNILIIEDEAKTARELKHMVQRLDKELQVTAILASVKGAIDWFQQHHPVPDLVFSDIQLADGLCFDIFRNVAVSCPVIFCTAFDQYAIQAFEANGIDYLLKPVDENRLAGSLRKYKQLKQVLGAKSPAINDQLPALLAQLQPRYKDRLLVFRNDQIIPVKTTDIAFIYSAGGMVSMCTRDRQVYSLREVLDELEPQLDPQLFFRANRQFIINRHALIMAEHFFNRRLVVKLNVETPERIVVSKTKAPALLAWMEGKPWTAG